MKVLPRRRRAVLINSVLGVAVLAGAGGAYAAVSGDSGGPARDAARTVAVTKGTVLATVSGAGSLSSPSDAGVNFTTGGRLTEVGVKAGDKVTKGQLLGKVDATTATETLNQARAALTAAQANLTKAEAGQVSSAPSSGSSSSRGGSASTPVPAATPTVDPAQLAQARAQLTQAQNAVDAAQRAVDGTVLKAPADGTVASVSAKVGDTVTGTNGTGSGSSGGSGGSGGNSASSSAGSSSTLSGFVVLTNPSGMQVTASFSEADALKLKPGQPATVTLNAMSGKTLNAQVLSVSSLPVSSGSSSGGGNASGGSAVQYSATLTITSPTADLRSGLSTSIQVVVGEASGALSVPAAAVSGTGENRTVTVVKADGTTVRTPVTLGLEGDSADQVVSGLTEGEQVQLAPVSSAGNGGFPSGTFPGGAGAGGARNRGGTGARTTGGGGGRG
ncbi:efflux RND transporter periplasmic adaptor subunit [Streptomyces sp. NBC_00503]|uniref:efflux RND transporter periplasmic adaptor subunit n=1 Tax=Streptomyces sp. NBC_00503 TaxID=2903659 RepID=UPI002E80541F|nr:HlyD family efflux transporter periplasmic adaptor subunit [Streptomyces sp. NBC_00503]WUD85256.1 HlyD family efflux transporter periplasmic adaptor subunit [Streptomyces sp. NBC_00503]